MHLGKVCMIAMSRISSRGGQLTDVGGFQKVENSKNYAIESMLRANNLINMKEGFNVIAVSRMCLKVHHLQLACR